MKRKGPHVAEPDMRPEYDFSGGVRGKYYRRYHESSNVVVIEPDVHEKFKSAAAVNQALRALIKKKPGSKRRVRARGKPARASSR